MLQLLLMQQTQETNAAQGRSLPREYNAPNLQVVTNFTDFNAMLQQIGYPSSKSTTMICSPQLIHNICCHSGLLTFDDFSL